MNTFVIETLLNSISIIDPFMNNVARFPDRNALWVNKQYYTYSQLFDHALPISNWLNQISAERVLIYSHRTFVAYQSIVAILLAGKAYVPLNPNMPFIKNQRMIRQADTQLIIVDGAIVDDLKEMLEDKNNWEVLILNGETIPTWSLDKPYIRFHLAPLTKTDGPRRFIRNISAESDACLLFTSGSTGEPKGVMLSHSNLLSYLRYAIPQYQITEHDRLTQMTELTFDFSVQDLFMSWSTGACVYALPENYFIGLSKYLNENQITFMTTVPSTARLLHHLGKLKKDSFPYLRLNIFGGEPFSDSIALLWQEAAPHSTIVNVCGPTEATIAILSYTWMKEKHVNNGLRHCIPLGLPYFDQKIMIIEPSGNPVKNGEVGELCLSGTQVVSAYWRNPTLTGEKFFERVDENNIFRKWYRTGDMVQWDDVDGVIFKGRVDDQIQIRGCRVEKLEIESVVRKVAETEFVAILPWPIEDDGTVQGVVAFISDSPHDPAQILQQCGIYLPDYMCPKEVYLLDHLPLNINGKIDYLSIKQYLVQQHQPLEKY